MRFNRKDFCGSPDRYQTTLMALKVKRSLLHLRLKAGFRPDQPRVPAGTRDGGRWSNGGTSLSPDGSAMATTVGRTVVDGTGDKPWSSYVEHAQLDGTLISRTVTSRDGNLIEARYPANDVETDIVTLRDGSRFVFVNNPDKQRIFDGRGNLLSESVWRAGGPEPQTDVRLAFTDDAELPLVGEDGHGEHFDGRHPAPAPRVFEIMPAQGAGIVLFDWWASLDKAREKTVLGFNAREYQRGPTTNFNVYGHRTREEVEQLCERLATVQTMTDRASAQFRPNMFRSAAARGTAVHAAVKREIDARKDPNFRAEISLEKSRQEAEAPYGLKDSVRIDVFERRSDDTICVYDLKIGRSRLNGKRIDEIARNVLAVFGRVRRVIVIEVRPE